MAKEQEIHEHMPHNAKHKELSEMLGFLREAPGWEQSEQTVIAGLAYHRLMLQMIEELG